MKIRKAVIPAAGLGTRFLPATKALPKEMLPIVDKPTIQYIVEEAVASGIEDILIISGRGKRAIEDHFDKSYELEEILAKSGKNDVLENVKNISALANIYYIRQKEPNGLGDAIYCARRFIADEPFAVLLGDDLIQSETPCLKQLMDIYSDLNAPIIAVKNVPFEDVSKYGIVSPKAIISNKIIQIDSLVEKPNIDKCHSNVAIMGRYILTPNILKILEKLPRINGAEIQLTDALRIMAEKQNVYAYYFNGERYDIGDKFGFIKATLDFAIKRPELKEDVLKYIKTLNKDN
ncbi:UTP--glucose-1-phosphate uridylyltransferase GalU [Bacillus mycoides]|uniref:UTP--glucose-1-phosphate uridylyltransferase GalU n=1 Tax=Bacillus mycoides TaxID=1405 RepID=UPI001C330AA1|nr:UTP--glucose-1-phosphate uridylyltransferase GalU [Bacillus mycoides]QWH53994.1 UTP--glucose-1-phosphate uridylyltransferase GalU [Bacillus mycoides]QWI14200.1 UTP--glucose-1-phosphate uridylyltransferase GalU [Bacillus mycoides]QWI57833.1 UTP--glucose-1-phosphate uridylyltransferase GalU [Bacillus mycoides]